MRIQFIRFAALFLCFHNCLFPLASSSKGQDGLTWETAPPMSVPAKELVSAAEEIEELNEDSASQLIYKHVRVDFKNDGHFDTTEHQIVRILTREGVNEDSIVEETWTPWYEAKPIIKARVISRRGTEIELDESTMTESTVGQVGAQIYSDDKMIQGALPNVRVGSVIEQLVIRNQERPFFGKGSKFSTDLGVIGSPNHWKLTVTAPAEMKIDFHFRGGSELQPERSTENGTTSWVFKKTNETNPLPVYWFNTGPDYVLVPMVGVTSGTTWGEIAAEYAIQVNQQIAAGDVAEYVADIEPQQLTRQQKIAAVLAKLNDRVRYTGLEFGMQSIIPRRPDEAWRLGLGDCKDKSTLMVAMLRKLGIEANVALLKSGISTDIDPELPALNSFNHAIVFVPGSKEFWIDPTAEYLGSEFLPIADQNRYALIASDKTTGLIKTPRLSSNLDRSTFNYQIRIRDFQPPMVHFKMEQLGNVARPTRQYSDLGSKKKLRSSWEEVRRASSGLKTLVEFEISDPLDVERPFRLEATYVGSNLVVQSDRDINVAVGGDSVLQDLPSELVFGTEGWLALSSISEKEQQQLKRSSKFVFEGFHQRELEYELIPPPGYYPDTLPEAREFKIGDFEISVRFRSEPDQRVKIRFAVETGNEDLTLEQFNQLAPQLKEVFAYPWIFNIRFINRSTELVEQRELKEALENLVGLEASFDNPWAYQLRQAKLILMMGLGHAARELAAEAVATSKDSQEALIAYAEILSCDLLGQESAIGFDLDGARSAYQKALDLEPENPLLLWNVAALTFRNHYGRYSQDPEIQESALKRYQRVLDLEGVELGAEQWLEYFVALVANEEWGELRDTLDGLETSTLTFPFKILLSALDSGAEEVEREMMAIQLEGREKSIYLVRLCQDLSRLGRYELANQVAELLDERAANVGSSNILITSKSPNSRISLSQPTINVIRWNR